MKKKMMKSTLAVALIAAAAFGGVKTYGAYSASEESNLLSENIEALSDEPGEGRKFRHMKCYKKECDSKQGEDAFICAEGTDRYIIYDCPLTQQKALPSSDSGSCVIEIK